MQVVAAADMAAIDEDLREGVAAGALDRLQVTVAPVIIGSGRPGIRLPEVADLRDSLRPRTRRFVLGDDMMIECDFRA